MSKLMEREETTVNKKVTLRAKNQVTIPNEAVEMLDLHLGDSFEVTVENGRIVLIPVVTIEKDQAWFWTNEWQQGEEEAQRDIEQGNVKTFDTVEALFDDLDDDGDDEGE